MNHQDNIRIITAGVEDARREQREQQAPGLVADFKLTVDLSKSNLHELPEEVVDLLKIDVERLQLAHNQICYIPDSFSRCLPLKYLNLRGNLFQEFPTPLLSLPQLEILDLSVNEIRTIPESIRSMRSLRVLSLTRNKIWDIPTCVKDLDTLRMLKLAGNPLRKDLAAIVDAKESHLPFDEAATDNEKETFITTNLKHHLKVEAANESGEGSSSEGPLETPRPLMRNGSLRFPVRTNGSISEITSEARSPGFAKPPIPARSHFRVTSGQNNLMQKSGLRRPGLAPLNVGNERNRSNSESILQATQNNRSKRMGMVPKKKNDLGTVAENQQNRNSFHLRGQSHASALRDWSQTEDISPSTTNGNQASRRYLSDVTHPSRTFVSHLTKSRKRRKQRLKPNFVDSAIGVRYSLSTLDQITNALIQSLQSRPQKNWSRVKDAQHDASFRIDSLHHSVNMLIHEGQSDRATRSSRKRSATLSLNACHSAIARYSRLANLLLDQSSQVMADGVKMYIRTLVSHVLGSSVEICHAFHPSGQSSKRTTITQKRFTSKRIPSQVTRRALHDEPLRDQSLTPTRERPVTARRIKNWNSPQQPDFLNSLKSSAAVVHQPPGQPTSSLASQPTPTHSIVSQPAVPLYLNGRSRSNSRADQYNIPSSTDSNFALSPAMTPSSLGAFSIPGTPLNRSRSSSIAAGAHGGRLTPGSSTPYFENDSALQTQFDKIHRLLEQTVAHSRKALPTLKEHFIRALDEAQTDLDRAHCEQWARRIRTCSLASELCAIVHKRLQAVVRSSSPDPSWTDKSFWDLAKKFLATISDLLQDVRAAFREGNTHPELVALMRPVSNLSRATSHEIRDSQWGSGNSNNNNNNTTGFLAGAAGFGGGGGGAVSPGSVVSTTASSSGGGGGGGGSVFGHHRQRRSSGENSYAASIPPTPLSAALGPAAQATIPSTPAGSGTLERSFQGGWGERADALLQMQQTMVYRR
ncbi:MAG: hypothetical protein Q9216_005509 [Gyalolechia sp. 2 TL-2023]